MESTQWEREYDERIEEILEARAYRDARPQPHIWPATGPDASWNPDPLAD